MTFDLMCLLGLALWSLVLNHAPSIGRMKVLGIEWGLSNREESPIVEPWIGRADRAQRNHHDNLPMLAIVILIAHLTQQNDTVTAMASIVILGSRILHGLVYIAGIRPLRGLFYVSSIVAMLVIVGRILT